MYKRLHSLFITFRYTSYTLIVCSLQLFAATIKAGTKTKSKREEKALIVPVWPASILSWLSRPRGRDFHSPCDRSNSFHRPPQPSYPFSPLLCSEFLFVSVPRAVLPPRQSNLGRDKLFDARRKCKFVLAVGAGGNLYTNRRGYFALALKWPISFTYALIYIYTSPTPRIFVSMEFWKSCSGNLCWLICLNGSRDFVSGW